MISGKCAKLLIGPTVPSPGPIPAMQVITELAAVRLSTPVAATKTVPTMNIKRNKATNEIIETLVFSLITLLLSFISDIAFG